MKVPARLKELDFWIERIGLPVLFCAFLCYVLYTKVNQIEKSCDGIKKGQHRIMAKLGIQRSSDAP